WATAASSKAPWPEPLTSPATASSATLVSDDHPLILFDAMHGENAKALAVWQRASVDSRIGAVCWLLSQFRARKRLGICVLPAGLAFADPCVQLVDRLFAAARLGVGRELAFRPVVELPAHIRWIVLGDVAVHLPNSPLRRGLVQLCCLVGATPGLTGG